MWVYGDFGKNRTKSSKYASKKSGLVLKMGVSGSFGKIRVKSSKYAPRNIVSTLKMRNTPFLHININISIKKT